MPKINSSFTATIRNPGKDNLLAYLTRRFTYHSQEEWQSLLTLGRLEWEGQRADGGEPLREGQSLRFAVVDYEEPEVPLDFKILEQSETLCLVHKPPGMPVHRTGKIFFQTLANLVREQLRDIAWAPLNRLDRETGGLVAFAKGSDALRCWAPASPKSHWLKLYAAITHGIIEPRSGRIELALGESGLGPIRSKVDILPGGKKALTLYKVLSTTSTESLVVLAPITGRKHQLRAHLAAIGSPIIGDKIYSQAGSAYLKQLDQELDEADYHCLGARHHLLHAFHLHLKKSEGDEIVGWDWDFNTEFGSYFNPQLIQDWCLGTGFKDLAEEANSLGDSHGPKSL